VLDALGPSWVRIDTLADFRQAQVVCHSRGDDANELASWSTNGSGTEHFVTALGDMNLNEMFLLGAFTDSTVTPRARLQESVILNAILVKLMRV